MLCFKSGVQVQGLAPEMLIALDTATEVFNEQGKDCIVTSARIGDKHIAKYSRHYAGLAVDLRRRHLTLEQVEDVRVALKTALGPDYKVLLESTHYHVSYKPRYPG